METYLIILAGGSGSRFGGPVKKQFIQFHGKELWKYVYDTACKILPMDHVVVVGIDIQGGKTRNESVKLGLEWIHDKGGDCSRVIICEAARALVTKEQLERIIMYDSPSCCFVRPVIDTVILLDRTYLTRSECRHLVSPQGFDYNLLYKAYQDCDLEETRTDETRLMYEKYGIQPDFLEGDENLYKVTYPKDIAIIEVIYQSMNKCID